MTEAMNGDAARSDVPFQRSGYSSVAILLHWLIAAFVGINLAVGFWMEGIGEPYRTLVLRLHQSSGITVLALAFIRLSWRLTHQPPSFDPGMARWERWLAGSVQILFYVAIIAIPLSGWALISANPPRYEVVSDPVGDEPPILVQKRIHVWGVVPLQPIAPIEDIASRPGGIARQHVLHEQLVHWHRIAGYAMLALILLHVAGALKHHFVDGHRTLGLMGWRRRS